MFPITAADSLAVMLLTVAALYAVFFVLLLRLSNEDRYLDRGEPFSEATVRTPYGDDASRMPLGIGQGTTLDQPGVCWVCGVENDPSYRYCRNCIASLDLQSGTRP